MTVVSSLDHMDWNLLRLFYFICQAPTLTEAGKYLKVTQPALSRNLANLESKLGYRLFNRNKKRLILAQEGQELLTLVTPVFQRLTQYQTRHLQKNQVPQGMLKLLIAPHLPVSWLMHNTANFLQNHPQLSFSLSQQSSFLMYYTQHVDCAIQAFDAIRQNDLIQKPLCSVSYGLYTARSYLDRYGAFNHIKDLKSHPKLVLRIPDTKEPFAWPKSVICHPQAAGVHEFSTAQDVFEATRHGLGIASLPKRQAAAYPDLVEVPLNIPESVIKLYYAYPKYYQDLKRVTLYGDFLEQTFKDDIGSQSQHVVPVNDFPLESGE